MSGAVWGVSSVVFKPMRVDYSGGASATEGSRAFPLRLLIEPRRAMPNWWAGVVQEIERVAALPDNWDERGAVRVNPVDVVDALNFLDRVMSPETRPPRLAPLSNGGIEILWRGEGLEVEAVFDSRRNDRSLMVEVGDQEWDAEIDEADSLFLSIRDRLQSHEGSFA